MSPPDRIVVAVCKACGSLASVLTIEEKRERQGPDECPECGGAVAYVRYQLTARAVAMSRRPPRAKAVT